MLSFPASISEFPADCTRMYRDNKSALVFSCRLNFNRLKKFQDSQTAARVKQNAPVAATGKKKKEDWRFGSESDIPLEVGKIQY